MQDYYDANEILSVKLPIVLIISLYDLRIYYKEPRIKVPRSNDQSVNDLLTNVIFIHGK